MSTISEVLGRRVQLKGLIGKRAMKCPYCDFYFMKNGSDLQRHIWAHEGEYFSPRWTPVAFCASIPYVGVLDEEGVRSRAGR